MDKDIRSRQASISAGERYPAQLGKAGIHMTVFEPSYLERDGWSGPEQVWLWAADGANKPKRGLRSERFD
jgi:hypothetical protein